MIRKQNLLVVLLAAAVAACGTDAPQALGTLEYDRIRCRRLLPNASSK
jgi:hypothetical protein